MKFFNQKLLIRHSGFINKKSVSFNINIVKRQINKMEKNRCANDFQIMSRLGQGAFGQVFKVKRKQDGEIYAMKKIKTITMKQKDRINALNEIRILASTMGDHIIGYKDSFYDEVSQNLCIVLQFAEQGDISRKITEHSKKKKFIEEAEIWKAMVHIAKGIRSLHDNNILHRDLKSANIFITNDGTYKLGDLNISKVLKKGLAHTQTGTPYYCSPEVWQDKPYGPKSDMWSFGCVLYEMAAQKPPFTASDIQGLYRKICQGVFSRIPNHYSNELSDVINSLLKLNPSLRPSVHDLLKNPIVLAKYGGQIVSEQPKSAVLLQTIQFNKQWKNLNNNLPKSKYQLECNQEQQANFGNNESGLKVPQVRVRPLSSRSDKKYMQNNSNDGYRNRSNDKQNRDNDNQVSQEKRERVMSAYGKRCLGASNVSTPERNNSRQNASNKGSARNTPAKNNGLVLPPIDPRRQRRASDNYDANMLPPRPNDPRRDNNKPGSVERNGSRERIRRAGQQVLQNGSPNYKINVSNEKKIDSPSRYY